MTVLQGSTKVKISTGQRDSTFLLALSWTSQFSPSFFIESHPQGFETEQHNV